MNLGTVKGITTMLPFDAEHVAKNAHEATTEDLLNRVTLYREGMEPDALDIIETELRKRGVSHRQIEEHQQHAQDIQRDEEGVALRCSLCAAPAVAVRWGWHRLWGKVPVFPRRWRYCREHEPRTQGLTPSPSQ
jgi:hypothetical protein